MIKTKEKTLKTTIEIDLTGPNGNAFYILGVAQRLCKQFGIDHKPLIKDMMNGDYEHLLKVFDNEFGAFVTMYR
tara:strand:- start:443 stop:664 length:222 start_codon:yes stop_codon:yes gene_type:complete